GRRSKQPRGFRDALRVIAGRGGDDAPGALAVAQRGDGVVGAAKLERTGALQVFALQIDPPACNLVEGGAGKQRRANRLRRNALRRNTNIVDGGGHHSARIKPRETETLHQDSPTAGFLSGDDIVEKLS